MYLAKKLIAAMGGLALAASLGMTQSKQSADHMFVTKASNGGMAEVEMGQLAVQHASDRKERATIDRLSKPNGDAFDRAYMQDMVKDHIKDVAEFQHESKSGKDSDIRNFASQTLPTLQEHLNQAKGIAPKGQSSQAKK